MYIHLVTLTETQINTGLNKPRLCLPLVQLPGWEQSWIWMTVRLLVFVAPPSTGYFL